METLTNEELVNEIQRGHDPEKILLLWDNIKRLATKICRNYSESYRHAEPDDLLQESFITMLRAADRYDPEAGAKFSSYYALWLHSDLKRYCDQCRPLTLPETTLRKVRKLRRLSAEYMMRFGREPSDRECSDLLEIELEEVDTIRAAAIRAAAVSLDSPVGESEGEPAELLDFVPAADDVEREVLTAIEAAEAAAVLWDFVRRMDKTGLDLLGKKYRDGMDAEQIADDTGIPAEKVKILQAQALKAARNPRNLRQIGRKLPSWCQAILYRQHTQMA